MFIYCKFSRLNIVSLQGSYIASLVYKVHIIVSFKGSYIVSLQGSYIVSLQGSYIVSLQGSYIVSLVVLRQVIILAKAQI